MVTIYRNFPPCLTGVYTAPSAQFLAIATHFPKCSIAQRPLDSANTFLPTASTHPQQPAATAMAAVVTATGSSSRDGDHDSSSSRQEQRMCTDPSHGTFSFFN